MHDKPFFESTGRKAVAFWDTGDGDIGVDSKCCGCWADLTRSEVVELHAALGRIIEQDRANA